MAKTLLSTDQKSLSLEHLQGSFYINSDEVMIITVIRAGKYVGVGCKTLIFYSQYLLHVLKGKKTALRNIISNENYKILKLKVYITGTFYNLLTYLGQTDEFCI